ncbi:hypothetical protein FUA23_11635 [Neolewinella aurantiaca]|uniref:DUF4382 domain-containing protein n=1 Tax=Neolewinella aurantiaca TaxID=2602767 RepID=A0A5C7FUN0_9BACT|nr:hypothetical protein [Neolewinella aurantiaca]TXF89155.1 hypothetical protein FUA23_11635 [Neolewinella aurantiaca]
MTFKSLPFFFALFTVGLSSCGLVDDVVPDITVDVDGSEIVFTLPEADEAGTFVLPDQEIPSEVVAKLNDENISADRVKSVKLNSALFRVATANAAIDFTAVDRVKLTITTPGLGTITLAENDFSDLSGGSVTLEVNDTELLDHLLSATSDFQLTITTNTPVPADTDLAVKPEFRLTASPL